MGINYHLSDFGGHTVFGAFEDICEGALSVDVMRNQAAAQKLLRQWDAFAPEWELLRENPGSVGKARMTVLDDVIPNLQQFFTQLRLTSSNLVRDALKMAVTPKEDKELRTKVSAALGAFSNLDIAPPFDTADAVARYYKNVRTGRVTTNEPKALPLPGQTRAIGMKALLLSMKNSILGAGEDVRPTAALQTELSTKRDALAGSVERMQEKLRLQLVQIPAEAGLSLRLPEVTGAHNA